MSTYCAVLMDVVSIQKYIFSSNELRNNIGASHIVKSLFEGMAVSPLAKACNIWTGKVKEIMGSWKDEPDKILLNEDVSAPFEIGVSGGGKALILFREGETAKKFLKLFTKEILTKTPGIQLAIAVEENFTLRGDFSANLNKLFKQLTINRNQYFPITSLSNHGITVINKEYLTNETTAKINASSEAANELANDYKQVLAEDYQFTEEVNKLGQVEGDNYTAIVHIDGNSIGSWFQASSSLADYRFRSINIQRITEDSFKELVRKIVGLIKGINNINGFKVEKNLPIRPLILGGDDVTFICHGKLGIFLAEKFIKIWTQKTNQELQALQPENGFTACAGIAIAKTKHPFYQTYQIAEELCSIAKRAYRRNEGGSWLDFYIINGTKSGSIENIRAEENYGRDLDLYFGPYVIEESTNNSCINHLKDGMITFNTDEFWTNPKLKELRTALYSGSEVLKTYLIDIAAKGGQLPNKGFEKYDSNYSANGYVDKRTPYADMLELIEFYPQLLLEGGNLID